MENVREAYVKIVSYAPCLLVENKTLIIPLGLAKLIYDHPPPDFAFGDFSPYHVSNFTHCVFEKQNNKWSMSGATNQFRDYTTT